MGVDVIKWAGTKKKKKNAHPAWISKLKSLRNYEFDFLGLVVVIQH